MWKSEGVLSRPDLSSFFMSLFWFGQGVSWGGHSMFLFYVLYFCFWPVMVPNQRQLSIIVSDWETYLGSLCSHYDLWVVVFCVCVFHTELFRVFIYFSCFFWYSVFSWINTLWTLTTLRIGPIFLTSRRRKKMIITTRHFLFIFHCFLSWNRSLTWSGSVLKWPYSLYSTLLVLTRSSGNRGSFQVYTLIAWLFTY